VAPGFYRGDPIESNTRDTHMAQEDDAVAVYQQLVRRPRGGTTIRSPKTRTTTSPAHASTGNQRLDEFLGGGLARGGATLLYGPPFSGKGVLQRTMFLAGLRQKAQSVFLLTDMAAPDFVDRVQLMDPRFREFQEEDLFHFVDAYSHLIGEKAPMAQTTFVPDLRSLDRILKAVEQVEAKLKARGQTIERLYVQSLSTMIMEAGTRSRRSNICPTGCCRRASRTAGSSCGPKASGPRSVPAGSSTGSRRSSSNSSEASRPGASAARGWPEASAMDDEQDTEAGPVGGIRAERGRGRRIRPPRWLDRRRERRLRLQDDDEDHVTRA
jgi:hypothetical protein